MQAEESGEVGGSQVVMCGMRKFILLYLVGSRAPLQVPKQIGMCSEVVSGRLLLVACGRGGKNPAWCGRLGPG